ncbi:MAG: hypothetical protein V1820_04400 [archaeon]
MVNDRNKILYPAAAFGIGVISPFLPRFGGQPFLALGLAAAGALLIPAKTKWHILLFLLIWAISFTLFYSIFRAGA